VSAVVGIDVGGTYTDLITAVDGETVVMKVPSTPASPSDSILTALELVKERGIEIGDVVHGVTIATNAVITRKGGPVALIATGGFSDVLEMRRRDRPHQYGLTGNFEPLVPRNLRFDATERILHDGSVDTPLDLTAVIEQLQALDEKPEAIAVCFLHAFRNPEHEEEAGRLLAEAGFERVSLSHQVSPAIGEFERMSTVVVNAFLQPVMSSYLDGLRDSWKERELGDGDLLILHGNGGAMTLDLAAEHPVRTVMSGPAGGVMAAQRIGLEAGFRNLLTCDVGGTSFDAAVIVDGQVGQAPSVAVDFGIPIRVGMTEVVTIGAGGGSIASVDRGGLLAVGPESAGADPGPVCYGRGGERPTLTDANVVLGRIPAESPIGEEGRDPLDREAAREAILAQVAEPLGVGVEEAATAMLEVANQKMAGALRLISVERGHDPTDFTIVAFGGGGPLHACALMREIGASSGLIPPHPGITSALGCLIADYRNERVRSVLTDLDEIDDARLAKDYAAELALLREEVADSGVRVGEGAIVEYGCAASFAGQSGVVEVRFGETVPDRETARARFEEQYTREVGKPPLNLGVILRDLKVAIRVPRQTELPPATQPTEPGDTVTREVWFGERWEETQVRARASIALGEAVVGPAIVEQSDTTLVIEPGFSAEPDAQGNLILRGVAAS
jgi:N-methylhydantoinase A